MIVGTKLVRRDDDGANQQLFERVGADHAVLQAGEELLQLTHPQRVEHDIAATGKQAVQRGAGNAGGSGDVVDADLGDAPLLAALLGGIEDARLRTDGHAETVRRICLTVNGTMRPFCLTVPISSKRSDIVFNRTLTGPICPNRLRGVSLSDLSAQNGSAESFCAGSGRRGTGPSPRSVTDIGRR